jgi:hypothetical protein
MQAGARYGQDINLPNFLAGFHVSDTEMPRPNELAEAILCRAMNLDRNRPNDDMSVIVLGILPRDEDQPRIRRMQVSLPLEPVLRR